MKKCQQLIYYVAAFTPLVYWSLLTDISVAILADSLDLADFVLAYWHKCNLSG